MRRLAFGLFLSIAMILGTLASHAGTKDENYNGHYELSDKKADRQFSLDIKQTHSRAVISFSAAMADGTGSAPDGTGKGRVEDGVLSFSFKDSSRNEGTCTLESKRDGYHLSMTVTKVVDPGPFHFYGNFLLKKISDAPQAP
jgi:hypothetical protein